MAWQVKYEDVEVEIGSISKQQQKAKTKIQDHPCRKTVAISRGLNWPKSN